MSQIEKILQGQTTVAGKIRALDAAGFPRAEIARILNKRYQHVRNVLEEPSARLQRENAERIAHALLGDPNTLRMQEQAQRMAEQLFGSPEAALRQDAAQKFAHESSPRVNDQAQEFENGPSMTSANTDAPPVEFKVHIENDGSVRLPLHVLNALDIQPGRDVTVRVGQNFLILENSQETLRRLRETVRRYVPVGSPSMADSLIADRRAEAASEAKRG